ncbi:hypothetical protein HK099_001389 [Clydaea vesicula]|uniref:Uncharacterized protein n=1 Tax=Clydaea vesicula TaxID=447962 RepID=A0AAD5TWU8_9FUNG|nr:hypothetical protein HK099_001389 [Clydaea vesicula]
MDNILTALEQDCAVEQSNLHQSNLLYQQSQFSQQHQRMISQQLNIQSMNHSSLAISQQHSQQLSRQQNFNILLDKTLPQHKHKMELLLEKLKNKEIDTESFGAEAKLYMEPPSNKKVSQNKVTVQQNQNQNTILKRTRSASGLNSSSSTSDLHQSKRIKQNDYQLQQQQILILKQKQLSFNVNPSSPQPSLPATPKQPEVEVENLMEISNFGGFNEKDEEDALYQTDYTHVREMPNGYDPNIDRIRVQNFMNIVGLKKMIQNIGNTTMYVNYFNI